MAERLSRSAARNIFYGGSVFFLLVLFVLTGQSHMYILEKSTDVAGLTESVVRGKDIWEENSCINCHTILGEGAYFAPELGNVWVRYGGVEDAEGARYGIKAWIESMPSGIEGRRQMPKYDFTDEEMTDLINFFEWVSRIDTQNWPPNDAG